MKNFFTHSNAPHSPKRFPIDSPDSHKRKRFKIRSNSKNLIKKNSNSTNVLFSSPKHRSGSLTKSLTKFQKQSRENQDSDTIFNLEDQIMRTGSKKKPNRTSVNVFEDYESNSPSKMKSPPLYPKKKKAKKVKESLDKEDVEDSIKQFKSRFGIEDELSF